MYVSLPSRPNLPSNNLSRIEPSLRLRRAIHANDELLCARILKSQPSLLHNPDWSTAGISNTSLHLASQLGHVNIVELLLKLGHEARSVSLNEHHQTPLILASREGHTDVVNLICESGYGAVDKQDDRGRDAIMYAAQGGHDTILQILLTFAPEPPPVWSVGAPFTGPIYPAWPAPHPNSRGNVKTHSKPGSASSSFSVGTVLGALAGTPAQRALLSHADDDGNTSLHFASSNGHLLALRTLLAAGADAERRNVWHWTPVAYSATVAAEVYFKNLITDVVVKKVVREEVQRKGTGGGVRLVGKDEGDDRSSGSWGHE